jgi:hypothetical protein
MSFQDKFQDKLIDVRDVVRILISVWGGVILLGFVMMTGGCIQTLDFLDKVETYAVITARQLVRELIIPHMVMLCGMGMLVGGFIFMVRRGVIEARMKHDEV